MSGLSKYADIFGKPGEGAHKYRIGNVASIDLILTILLAFLVSGMSEIPVSITITILLLLSFIFHLLFGVKTSSAKWFAGT
jgi:hypothetical protein